MKAAEVKSSKVVEELCNDSNCRQNPDWTTHWHPLSIESLLAGGVGQYTITVRVRKIKTPR